MHQENPKNTLEVMFFLFPTFFLFQQEFLKFLYEPRMILHFVNIEKCRSFTHELHNLSGVNQSFLKDINCRGNDDLLRMQGDILGSVTV